MARLAHNPFFVIDLVVIGYGSEADTWEPSHNIICSSVVKEYWHRRKEQEQAQETKEKKTGRILLTKKEDDTLRCDVCLGMDGMVLRCAVCTIPVHAHCYGTTNIASCGIWYYSNHLGLVLISGLVRVCEACAAADGKSKSKACIFCPTTNHHLKSLPDGRWAHIVPTFLFFFLLACLPAVDPVLLLFFRFAYYGMAMFGLLMSVDGVG